MKRYIAVGLLVFVCGVIASFPARVAYRWFAPPDLQLSVISGSIWRGAAAEGMAAGVYVRDLEWRFRPAALLSGRLAFATSCHPASGTLDAEVAIGTGGKLTLTDLVGNLSLDMMHPAFQANGIRGDLRFSFRRILLAGGRPVEASGRVTVDNFFSADLSAAPLGNFDADIQTSGGEIRGSIDDVSGVLDIEGGTLSIRPDGSYFILGEVAARPAAPPSVQQQLRFLPNGDQPGYRQFRFEGQL